MQALTAAEAKTLVQAAGYTVGGDPGSRRYGDPEPATSEQGEPRTVIHVVTGMLRGADWDLTDALVFLDTAETIGWDRHIVGHDLVAIGDGRTVRFDVRQPR